VLIGKPMQLDKKDAAKIKTGAAKSKRNRRTLSNEELAIHTYVMFCL
jgi:hypothetical protein